MPKKEGDERPRTPDNAGETPRLWLRKTVPFEHHVVPYRQLHQDLKDAVDRIRESVDHSRFGLVGTPAMITMFGTTSAADAISFATYFTALVGSRVVQLAKYETHITDRLLRGKETPNSALNRRLASFFMPYAYPHLKTLQLGKLIKKIASREEAPLGKDSTRLLSRFHYGVVDNAGNIILLRHPSLSQAKGWRKLKQTLSWEQPLQRTRFELQKPPRKARLPLGEWLKQRLPARPVFALARIR